MIVWKLLLVEQINGRWGSDVEYLGMGGGRCQDLWNILQEKVKAVILFRFEMWVTIPHIVQTLLGFYHVLDQRMEGMRPRRNIEVRWEYSTYAEALSATGLEEV